MGWLVLFIAAWLLALTMVPMKEWKRLWPAGVAGLATNYILDSTLIGLEAYSFSLGNPLLSGMPTFYFLSVFAGGVLLAYYYPNQGWWQIIYVMLMAAAFLFIEVVMYKLGYFHYQLWSPARSYMLNIGGFIVVLWLAQKANAVGKGNVTGN